MPNKSKFCISDVHIDAVNTSYEGYFKIIKYRFKHRLFSGAWSGLIERELFERGHAVGLLAYDPFTDEVVLIEQIRVGAIAANASPWQLEIIAGMIGKEEEPEEVAIRESKEEAGIEVNTLFPISRYLSSSGGSSERISLYLGLVDATKAHGIHGLIDEGEDIRVLVVSRETAMGWVLDGTIENAASIIALQWLALNVDAHRSAWQKVGAKHKAKE